METKMKAHSIDTVPLQLLTIQTKNGERWVFIGSPAVLPNNMDISNAIVDVWFSNIQDISQDATIRSLVEMMDKQNLSSKSQTSMYTQGTDTLQ